MFATDKQIAFINSLTSQVGEERAARITFDIFPNFRGFDLISKRGASLLIDALIEARDTNPEPEIEYSDAEIEEMFDLLDC